MNRLSRHRIRKRDFALHADPEAVRSNPRNPSALRRALWSSAFSSESFRSVLPEILRQMASSVHLTDAERIRRDTVSMEDDGPFTVGDVLFVIPAIVAQGCFEWPASEQDSVREYFVALFAEAVGTPEVKGGPKDYELQSLMAFQRMLGSSAPLIAAWDADTSPDATLRLADFIRFLRDDLISSAATANDDVVSRWETPSPVTRSLVDWLTGDRVRRRLEAALDAADTEQTAERFLGAINVLDRLERQH